MNKQVTCLNKTTGIQCISKHVPKTATNNNKQNQNQHKHEQAGTNKTAKKQQQNNNKHQQTTTRVTLIWASSQADFILNYFLNFSISSQPSWNNKYHPDNKKQQQTNTNNNKQNNDEHLNNNKPKHEQALTNKIRINNNEQQITNSKTTTSLGMSRHVPVQRSPPMPPHRQKGKCYCLLLLFYHYIT